MPVCPLSGQPEPEYSAGGQYSGDGGRFRKKKSKVKENGKVIQKNTASSFDIKI